MKLSSFPVLPLTGLALALSVGCSSDGTDMSGGTGGSGAIGAGGTVTGGSTNSGGSTPTGGSTGNGGSTGGTTQTGGSPSTGGATSGGSTSTGGSTGGQVTSGGTGGSSTGGSGGESGGTTSGGSGGTSGGSGGGDTGGSGGGDGKVPPRPSTGCGKANPQTGTSSNPLNDGKPYYVKLPTNYDENTPYRVLFMFNPTGNPITWAENSAGYENLSAKDTAIRVYPHENPGDLSNSPGGWSGDDVASFEPLYNAIMDNFCVDQERVFATGESSGGDFSSVLGCEYGDKLRGVGPCATKPVNGYPLNVGQRNCKGDVTAIVIHGQNDNVVGPENGPATRDFYTALNECSGMSEPVDGYTDNMSNCVMFTGCKEGYPVYWCQHQDPEYSGTNHGWPKFAAKMTWEVFESY